MGTPFLQVEVKGSCSNGPKNGLINCESLKWSDCPTDEVIVNPLDTVVRSISLVLKAPRTSDIAGCYSTCSKLTMNNWGNSPTFLPATPRPPNTAALVNMTPAQLATPVRFRRQVTSRPFTKTPQTYGFAYDDGVGLWTCSPAPPGTRQHSSARCRVPPIRELKGRRSFRLEPSDLPVIERDSHYEGAGHEGDATSWRYLVDGSSFWCGLKG